MPHFINESHLYTESGRGAIKYASIKQEIPQNDAK